MSPADAVRLSLLSDAAIVAIFGTRFYPGLLPPKVVYPAAVITVISQDPMSSFDGSFSTELVESRVQVDCYAKDYDDAHDAADAVAKHLVELNSQELRVAQLGSRDLYENETLLHRVSTDFSVWRGR